MVKPKKIDYKILNHSAKLILGDFMLSANNGKGGYYFIGKEGRKIAEKILRKIGEIV